MVARLQDKIALITGGSRGIGAAIATAMGREGATIVISARKQEGLEEARRQMAAEGIENVHIRPCHIGRTNDISELLDWCVQTVGTPTILVNNAATNPYFGPLLNISEAQWDKTFEVNVKGYLHMTQATVKAMKDAQLAGSIINISSISGLTAAPLQGAYGMTKAALISMTKTLAVELGSSNIRVNAIAPGLVATRFSKVLVETPELVEHYNQRTALNRYATPDEIAGMAVYLGSEESSFVTGQTYAVDGGYSIT